MTKTQETVGKMMRPVASGIPDSLGQFQMALDAAYEAGQVIGAGAKTEPTAQLSEQMRRVRTSELLGDLITAVFPEDGEKRLFYNGYEETVAAAIAQVKSMRVGN